MKCSVCKSQAEYRMSGEAGESMDPNFVEIETVRWLCAEHVSMKTEHDSVVRIRPVSLPGGMNPVMAAVMAVLRPALAPANPKPAQVASAPAQGAPLAFSGGCCGQATIDRSTPCVCAYVTTCPTHGLRHHGTHD